MRNPFGAAVQLAASIDSFPTNAPAVFPRRNFRLQLEDPKVQEQLLSYRNTVYKATNFQGNQVMQLGRGVVEVSMVSRPNPFRGGQPLTQEQRVPVLDHAVTQMLAKGSQGSPNPYTTSGNYISQVVIDLNLAGYHRGLKIRDSEGVPRWILRLRPDWTKIIPDPQIGISGYTYRPGGGLATTPMIFAPSEIVDIKRPSPLDERVGWSPLRSMAYAADLGTEIRRYQWQFFEQGARIDGVITGADTSEQVDQAYDLLVAGSHKGADKAWLPLVLPAGLDWKPTQSTAKDFEFAELANFSEQDILEAYGVPRGLLGDAKDIPMANLRSLMVISAENGIKPLLRLIEEHIEACLLGRDFPPPTARDTFLEFDFQNPSPRDPEDDRARQKTDLETGTRTINMVRAERGEQAVPWGDVPYVNASLVPLDQLIADANTGGNGES